MGKSRGPKQTIPKLLKDCAAELAKRSHRGRRKYLDDIKEELPTLNDMLLRDASVQKILFWESEHVWQVRLDGVVVPKKQA